MEGEKQKYLLTIDIVKGIAIWMVILVHSRQTFLNLAPWLRIFDIGQMGCQMFFVVSGLTSMMSYERLQSCGKFYRKRIEAIIPGWWAAIFLIYILNSISLAVSGNIIRFGANRKPLSILCNLLLLHGLLPFCNNNVYGGAWFIGTLAVFYVAAPAVYKLYTKLIQKDPFLIKCIPWIAQIIACTIVVGAYFITKNPSITLNKYGFAYYNFISQSGCFLLGAVLYFELKNGEIIKKDLWLRKILCIVCLYMLFHMFFTKWAYYSVLVSFAMGLFTYNLLLCMIAAEIRSRKIFEGSLICNVLGKYGKHSYYIYLMHFYFVWSIPLMIQGIFGMMDIRVNDNVIYFVWIIPAFILSYYTALLFEKVLKRVQKFLGSFFKNTDYKC